MSLTLWFAFVAASAVLLIIPGPTILAVISCSFAHGKRARLPLVAAVALGDSTALVLSLLGLNAALCAVFAGAARRLLASARAQRVFNVSGGSLLTAAGVWALWARRPA